MDCPDEQTLLQYADGLLDEAAGDRIDAHIDACPRCAEVAALAIAECGDGSELSTPPPGDDSVDVHSVPNVIGRYVTIGRLGSGGMGTVYSAHDPDLQRNVALKLLRSDYAERGDLLRREAQSLATLAHPNVVQAFGVGRVGDCTFLVMELVDGLDLRRWRAQRRRTEAEIVDAYVQAGRGLAAAHALGLAHCDFKPENVLVGWDGVVRVSDFGLARVIATAATSDHNDREANERTTTVMGTPAYMAPEQRHGRPPDAKADQYSFCVSLWEALTGKRPNAGEKTSPPGTRRVRRVLLRGLSLNPSDRWPSMDALLAALTQPAARSWRPMVGGVALATFAAFAVLLWSALRPDACDRAESARSEAWSAPQRAALMWSGVAPNTLDAIADWSRAWDDEHRAACAVGSAPNVGVTQCLETTAQALADLIADNTAVREGLDVHRVLGHPGRCGSAQPTPNRLTRDEVRRVTAMRVELARALTRSADGSYDEALASTQWIESAAQELGYAPLLADVQLTRGNMARQAGDNALAHDASQEAYLLGKAHGLRWVSATAATTMFFLVAAIDDDVEGAVPWMRHAESAIEQLPPRMRAGIEARLMVVRGHWHEHAGRIDEARAAFERGVTLTEQTLGPDHPDLALALSDLGTALTPLDPAAGLSLLERALAISIAAYGHDHPRVDEMLSRLATHHERIGQSDRALSIYRRILENAEARYGPEHAEAAKASYNLGNLLADLGEPDKAAKAIARARRIWTATYGPDHMLVGYALDNLGALAYDAGELERAKEFYNKALLVFDRTSGPESARHFVPLSGLAEVNIASGRGEPAVHYAGRALGLAKGQAAEDRASVRFRYARALWLAGRPQEAMREAELAAQEARTGDDPLNDGASDVREIEAWLSERTDSI